MSARKLPPHPGAAANQAREAEKMLRIEGILHDLNGASIAMELAARGLRAFAAENDAPSPHWYDGLVSLAERVAELAEGADAISNEREPRWAIRGSVALAQDRELS